MMKRLSRFNPLLAVLLLVGMSGIGGWSGMAFAEETAKAEEAVVEKAAEADEELKPAADAEGDSENAADTTEAEASKEEKSAAPVEEDDEPDCE